MGNPELTTLNSQPRYLSPNRRAWQRLLKNKPAVLGLVIIILAILLAIFAPFIAADHTPNANEQVLEINTEKPGFSIQMLRIPKKDTLAAHNWISTLWSGRENPYQLVPIMGYRIQGEQLMIDKYAGKKQPTTLDSLQLSALDPTLSSSQKSSQELSQIIAQNHIVNRYYPLGTDKFGRDNLSRLILGVRISLSVGLMAVLISLSIGIALGAIAGYFRGRADDVISAFINLFWSIPLLLLVFALVMALGREFWQIYLAVGLTMWVEVARLVRGQVISLREREFVEAARSLGVGHARIITRHILPNIMGPVMVLAASDFASAIIIEAGLSFLGIGVQPPTPSWGTMLNEYYGYIGTNKAFLAIIPGGAICLLVLAFNLLGNGLRDALDVKLQV